MTDLASLPTGRWRGVVAVGIAAVGLGLALRRPELVLLSVLGVVYAAYPSVLSAPEPDLELDRTLDPPSPGPGEPVEVAVTVKNVADSTLFDLRVVDGVPQTLRVIDGSPRHGGVLRPGRSLSWSYRVRAERGKHGFDPATVVAADPSGAHEVERQVATSTEIDCTAGGAAAPLRRQTLRRVGQILSDRAGSGVEFHRTREYRRGDPMSRIDWNRYAKSGEFTTVEYRREQAASVVVLVDARAVAYRGRPDEPHAVAYGVSAARQFVETLVGDRNRVGVAGLGRSLAWEAPGVGREHGDDLQRTLSANSTFAARPPTDEPSATDSVDEQQVDALRERLPDGTQVLAITPLVDDAIVTTLRSLDVEGYATSVLSPSVTRADTPGRRLATVERRHRIATLREADMPVVEWEPTDPLAAAVSRAESGVTA